MTRVGPPAAGLALWLMLGFVACGGDPGDGRTDEGDADRTPLASAVTSSAAGYVPIEVVDGGTVRGAVRYTGEVPAARSVPVTGDTAVCGSMRQVQRVRVGPAAGLADAVVSLTDIRRGAAFAPEAPPELDQRGCRFTPHVLVVSAGGTVRVRNGDPVTHNIHTAAFDNRAVNRTQPAGLGAIELRFDAPEKVRVKCDLHPWMGAWIVVADHPYHAVTDEAGSFALTDVPPGAYTVEVWHEALGTRTRTVSLGAGETVDLTVDMAAGD